MTQTLRLPFVLPGFNQLVAPTVRGRCRVKAKAIEDVSFWAKKLQPVARAVFRYHWIEPNRRRDPSNVAAGGRKVIEDALKQLGKIPGDGWSVVAGFSDTFEVNRGAPGVVVIIEPVLR